MGDTRHDIWLVVVGFLHPLLSLLLLVGSGLRPFGADPLVYSILSPLIPTAAVLGAWEYGEGRFSRFSRFSRFGVVAFVAWMAADGFAHLWILFTAWASV